MGSPTERDAAQIGQAAVHYNDEQLALLAETRDRQVLEAAGINPDAIDWDSNARFVKSLRRRRWWKRHWKKVLLLLILALIVVAMLLGWRPF